MSGSRETLGKLGWTSRFEQQIPSESTELVARVVMVDRDWLWVADGIEVFRARLAGSLLHRATEPHDLPCVGDWVCLKKSHTDDFGVIHARLERKTSLSRKAAGDATTRQMIAANIDHVVVVQSCHFDFNLNRLARYLVMAREGGCAPLVLLTKTDLVAPEVLAAQLSEIRSAHIDAPVFTLSNVTQEGVADFERLLLPGKTYCFVGSSGVGKSTLINHLTGQSNLETNTVSSTGEGRHTSVRRELIQLEGGALVIDNPGMREFGLAATEAGLRAVFTDIASLASRCRYRDCSHTGEPDCAVLAALDSGELDRDQYANFLKLRKESAFHEMSQVERRRKDLQFRPHGEVDQKTPRRRVTAISRRRACRTNSSRFAEPALEFSAWL